MTAIDRTKNREIPAIFRLYHTAFPRSERKPFSIILRMAREGRADLWTIRRDGRFAGFAATVNGSDIVLLDYFAVKKTLRGQGVGSAALCQIEQQYAGRGFFIEIESTFEEAANRDQREKRKTFYVNCGMGPMNTEADVFGVRMELLGVRCHLDFDAYRRFYREHYSPWAAEHIREVQRMDLREIMEYWRRQGAPGDQNALRNLLSEIQQESGGAIPQYLLAEVAAGLGVKETFLIAIIRRIPSLRLADHHVLEVCAGPNCARRGNLAQLAEQYRGRVEVKLVPCMRQCGKGPNIRFDGKLYNGADEALLKRLIDEK